MSNTQNITFDADILPALKENNIPVIEQTAFYKLASDRKAVYIGKSKKRVTRIDISGFEVNHPAINPPKSPNGKVKGQIDMKHPQALEALATALEVLVNGKIVGDKFVKRQD